MNAYGRFTNNTKPVVLRSIFRELTGDASGSSTLSEAEVDKRLKEALLFEDVDIIVDLHELNEGRKSMTSGASAKSICRNAQQYQREGMEM